MVEARPELQTFGDCDELIVKGTDITIEVAVVDADGEIGSVMTIGNEVDTAHFGPSSTTKTATVSTDDESVLSESRAVRVWPNLKGVAA